MTDALRVVSYGGGVQSTALLVLAARKEIDFPVFMFANVGDDSEHPATLVYVHEIAMPYAAAHGIELAELRSRPRGGEGTLYQKLTNPEIRSVGIPVRMASGAPGRRQCTGDFKIKRIASHLKLRGACDTHPAVVALGISIDEYQRMRTESGISWETLTYPLIDLRLSREDCMRLIADEGLPVPPKSSCWFCPFHTMRDWREQQRSEPDLFTKSVELERTLNAKRQVLGKDPVWLSDALKPLDAALAPTGQAEMFDEDGASCDVGGYCMS